MICRRKGQEVNSTEKLSVIRRTNDCFACHCPERQEEAGMGTWPAQKLGRAAQSKAEPSVGL